MALAHSARMHVGGTDVAALRVTFRACSFCGCGDRVTNRIEPRIMIFTVRCIQTESDRWMVPLSCGVICMWRTQAIIV